jgi:hypothetical protein
MWGMLETTDVFTGALAMCCGGRLVKVNDWWNPRQVSFVFEGEGLGSLDPDHHPGQLMVDAVRLWKNLNHLRDITFKRLRTDNSPASAEATADNPPTQGLRRTEGRLRDDRERENRGAQERC